MLKQYLVTATLLLAVQSASAELYKWVDENGVTRYSDHLPAQASKKAHDTLNNEGIVVDSNAAALTIEQRQKLQQEAKRQAVLEQQQELAQQEQQRRDRVLLMTFSSESDIQTTRDERLEVVDSVIKLLQQNVASAEQEVVKLNQEAQPWVSKGQKVPGGLAQKIEFFTRKSEKNQNLIAKKHIERNKIIQEFETDIARYRKLKRLDGE